MSGAARLEAAPLAHAGGTDAGPWPRGVSRHPALTIGAVVKLLKREFPATTVSKVRFLEEKGLVKPHRNPSGYRKYSDADVQRLRFILLQQRDSYAPLRVIGEHLDALDAGQDVAPEPAARIVASDGKSVQPADGATVTVRELGDLTGTVRHQLDQYVTAGLIAPNLAGRFPAQAVQVVRLLAALEARGVPLRQLRSVRNGAERSADIIDQVVSSGTRMDRAAERERARADAQELGLLFADLHSQLLRGALAAALGE